MAPKIGDVLVSNPTATIEHNVSIVPAPPDVVCRNHDSAVVTACELAQARQVDAWITEDHRHYLKIASHRGDVARPITAQDGMTGR